MARAADAAAISVKALTDAFSRNLRMHVRNYESISALCRACDVNRQQFNKYLNGETLPSMFNLVKIARTLGVEVDDLVRQPETAPADHANPMLELARVAQRERRPITTGYYQEYTPSAVFGGHVLVSLCRIDRRADAYACKLRLAFNWPLDSEMRRFTYRGAAFASREAVYLYYAHEAHPDDLVYCVMQPYLRYSADLIGMRTAMSNSIPAVPFAAAFYMRHLGERPDLRDAVRSCGIFRREALDEKQAGYLARLESKVADGRTFIRIGPG
jgi:transcriptional regulator with XRE-family HTH domain